MKQGQMPPVMDREHVVRAPVVPPGRQPLNPIVLAALHFHDMRNSVYGPGVPSIQSKRSAPLLFGSLEQVRLLEAEGVHAEQVSELRIFFAPRGQRARDPVPKQGRLAKQESDVR